MKCFGCDEGGHAGGRSERRLSVLDVMKEDMQEVGAREDEVFWM